MERRTAGLTVIEEMLSWLRESQLVLLEAWFSLLQGALMSFL